MSLGYMRLSELNINLIINIQCVSHENNLNKFINIFKLITLILS